MTGGVALVKGGGRSGDEPGHQLGIQRGGGCQINLVVYKIRILYALTYTVLHYLFSDFLESIKHQASFSDNKQ